MTKDELKEVVNVMISGGEQVYDDAIAKWLNPNYCPQIEGDSRYGNIQRWKRIRSSIRDVANKMKEQS